MSDESEDEFSYNASIAFPSLGDAFYVATTTVQAATEIPQAALIAIAVLIHDEHGPMVAASFAREDARDKWVEIVLAHRAARLASRGHMSINSRGGSS